MSLRTILILLMLVCGLTGCRSAGWGFRPTESSEPELPIENFSRTENKPKDNEEEPDIPSGMFSRTNGRTDDPGSGLSSRSRDIEKSLGYQ